MRRALFLLLAIALSGCGSANGTSRAAGGGKLLSVVTTTTQLADFAHVIGGGHVTVYGVLKANVDPHDYEATPADIEAIGKAGVILKNGIGLEKWFEPAIKSAAPKGRIVDASAGADIHKDDPHVWHDPRNAKVMVRNLTDAFAAADAANAAAYRSAEAAYDKELDALDAENAAKINALADKKLVTNHDAFGYYVARYGLDLVGEVIPSFDTQAELSASEVSALVAKIKAEHVKAVFSESSLPPKTAAAIAREAGVKVVQGDDALYGDTLGPAGSDGDTYLKMERHNTRVIVANLG